MWNYTAWSVESVRFQSFPGPYFPTFGQITEICKVNLGIQPKARKKEPEKIGIQTLLRIFNSSLTLKKSYSLHLSTLKNPGFFLSCPPYNYHANMNSQIWQVCFRHYRFVKFVKTLK